MGSVGTEEVGIYGIFPGLALVRCGEAWKTLGSSHKRRPFSVIIEQP